LITDFFNSTSPHGPDESMSIHLNSQDIAFFRKIVGKAGTKAATIQQKGVSVSRKADHSIVTQADIIVQEYLISRITKRFGHVNFIYEEGNHETAASISEETITVIIDPIDGTSMFSMHMPIWCVSLGVFQGNNPLYGFVYAPGMNMFFHNDDNDSYINNRPVHISNDFIIDSESNIFYATEIYKHILIDFPGKARNLGSTALHACLTIDNARNRTLAFIGKSWIWDWAGPVPIILKAGGSLRYMNGDAFNLDDIIRTGYAIPEFLIAYTCRDFEDIKKIFRPL